ncbi:hypothetical protein RAA17_14185 [Komagataeibacter rhaeticus]|nr:hypothetical protein [Komagataeibacter rhaeticus]
MVGSMPGRRGSIRSGGGGPVMPSAPCVPHGNGSAVPDMIGWRHEQDRPWPRPAFRRAVWCQHALAKLLLGACRPRWRRGCSILVPAWGWRWCWRARVLRLPTHDEAPLARRDLPWLLG